MSNTHIGGEPRCTRRVSSSSTNNVCGH